MKGIKLDYKQNIDLELYENEYDDNQKKRKIFYNKKIIRQN